MPRGKVKVIKSNVDTKDLNEVIGQLFGQGDNMDFEIAMDKLNKLRSNMSRVLKFMESFDKAILSKVLEQTEETKKYKEGIHNFVQDCKEISEWSEFGRNPLEVGVFYKKCKESKTVADCISICRNLNKFKKSLGDDLSDDFIKSQSTKDLVIFPFCDFDVKFLYIYGNIDDSVKKYIMIFLSVLLKSTKEIYEVITSPDIDIDKVSKIVVDVIASTKKMLPRCGKAFSKLESSMELLKKNFADYYKDFLSTKDQSTIITNFIADCTKEEVDKSDETGRSDIELTRQFMEITNFFRKQSAGKVKDPAVAQLLEFLDKQFEALDLDE